MWPVYKTEPTGVDDLVNYAFLVAPGIMLLKDGALLTAWHFQGPDLDYAAPEELERLSMQVSSAFRRCGNGWMLHTHVFRRESQDYLPAGAFPDPTSALIDEERRRRYQEAGTHFASVWALALTYLPPPEIERQLSALFYEGGKRKEEGWNLILDAFHRTVGEIEDLLTGVLRVARMTDAELLTYLHLCVTGVDHPVSLPSLHTDLDAIIANQDLVGGFRPQMGRQHVRVISLDGYPSLTRPGAHGFLHELPMVYTWSTRFIFLDTLTAEKLIEKKRKHWWQRRHKFGAVMGEAAHGEEGAFAQQHPVQMAIDANEASAEAASGEVVFGLYTMTILVMDDDEARADHKARDVQKHIQQHGFGARIEEANALEAIIGSWPGHGYQNLRTVPIHSLNLADLLPLTSIWIGQPTHPNPYFPPDSSALMLTATAGQTPFYVTPWVGDVGHTLVLGPVGSGKSTLLGMLAAQCLRYPGAQVFWFDKGYSSYVLCHAVGGDHYDIGADEQVAFTPLAGIADEREREWALGWLEDCLVLQGVRVTVAQRRELWGALTRLGESEGATRTLTDFLATVQDDTIRAGLAHYALGGGAGSLLDATQDSLHESHFLVFEMEHLLARGDTDLVPVLLYLFHRVEQRLDEGRPTLIPIDEAWLMMLRARFGDKIEEWLRTLRKKNAAVLFTSQSLTDVLRCPQSTVLIESCQTKILLPNAEARTAQSTALYQQLGLNDTQIELLAYATPKKHYLYLSPLGRRLFDMHLGPAARSFVGIGGQEEIRRVRQMVEQYGAHWPAAWLTMRGCAGEAEWWSAWHTRHHRKESHIYASLFTLPHTDDAARMAD